MAALTPRFKLNAFGGGTPGTITDDGQKFTGLDRFTTDRLLSQTEVHDHKYHPLPGALSVPAVATLLTEGGALQGGYTYYYRFSVVDEQGNESLASVETSVPTPTLLPIPGMPSASVDISVGALTPGLYYYGLTALRGVEETPLGQATLVALQNGETAVLLELPDFGVADSVRVWRMGSTESGYTSVALVAVGATEYVDDGSVSPDPCATDPANQPPQTNTGTASYAVTVDLPVGVDLTTARSWRLYRTVYPGIYSTSSLVHDVVERADEWDPLSPLLTSWTDTGGRAVSGKPMDADLNMRFQTFTFDSAMEGLPDPVPYPQDYPLVFDDVLYVKRGDVWVAVSAATGGGALSGGGALLTSPVGNRFILGVADDGTLQTYATDFPGPPAALTDVVVN